MKEPIMTDNGQHQTITVFGASRTEEGSPEWQQAFTLGADLGRRGFGIVTGGYGGSMEAASAGVASVSADFPVIGVTVPGVFRTRSGANRWVTREIQAPSLLARIDAMLADSVAAVALPGSLGTFTEVMVAWNLAYVARFGDVRPRPLITVGDTWRDLCAQVGELTATDTGLVVCVQSVDDVVPALDTFL
jgi:uncharacterized protein (TIGR00725 family)